MLREVRRLVGDGDGRANDELVTARPAGDPLAGLFVGRDEERRLLGAAFERLLEGASEWAVAAVTGPLGAGRRALISEALGDLALARLARGATRAPTFAGDLVALADWLQVGPARATADQTPASSEPGFERQRWFARLTAALLARGQHEPVCVALAAGSDEEDFATHLAGAPAEGHVLVLLPAARPIEKVGALNLPLAGLTTGELQSLLALGSGLPVEDPRVSETAFKVHRATGGHAGMATLLARALVDELRRGVAPREVLAPNLDFAMALERSFAGLSPAARFAVARAYLDTGAVSASGEAPGDPSGAVDEALAAGWLVDAEGASKLPSEAHEAVIADALVAVDLRPRAAQAIDQLPESDPRRGVCLVALGRPTEAARAFRASAAALSRERVGAAGRAARWLEQAARLSPGDLSVEERLLLAEHRALHGRWADASAVLEAGLVGEPTPPLPDRLRLFERQAWVLGRSGRPADAEALLSRTLEDAVAAHGRVPSASLLAPLRARRARLLMTLGRYADAAHAARPALTDASAGPLALEATFLADVFARQVAHARAHVGTPAWGRLPPGKASYLEALAAQVEGRNPAALDLYARARVEAERAGDIHTAAAIALNLGAMAAAAGRYGEALSATDRAVRELGQLGAAGELATALFNAAMLLLDLGDLIGARRMIGRLRAEGGRASDAGAGGPAPGAGARLAFLEAELARREGDPTLAARRFRAAVEGPADPPVARAARLALLEVLAVTLGAAPALAAFARDFALPATELGPVTAGPGAGGDTDAEADARLTLGRILLARGPGMAAANEGPDRGRLAELLERDAARAADEGRRPAAWRGALVAARLFHATGALEPAARNARRARQLFEEVKMATPMDHHPGLDADLDARFLRDVGLATLPPQMTAPLDGRGGRGDDRMRRLLRINKRLNSELRLPRLLDLILDTVIELTDAERGFLLLEDDKGELSVKVARNIDQQTLQASDFELSRSIATRAAAGAEPIVTIDAAGDPRFKRGPVGHGSPPALGAGGPAANQGAIGGHDLRRQPPAQGRVRRRRRASGARLRRAGGHRDRERAPLGELRRRERQIEVLNRRLETDLAARKEELSSIKVELRENREALALRYDYRNIVGRTPRMMELFRLLDRLTDTSLPVVIQGESGTGKELVARALHFNGPRRTRAFVSENCAAIPETLLESTLFGSVRGAFTGADHDTRGLFEVADGGTLFLDEVAEMSPSMQGKLLRVLQSGEVRRVGAERTRHVDVRIVAASNRDLARMVEEGKFRQDLYFRLCVGADRLAAPA